MTVTDPDRWELRLACVYGSHHVGYWLTREDVEAEARRRIATAGSVGRIECVRDDTRTVYFDECEEC